MFVLRFKMNGLAFHETTIVTHTDLSLKDKRNKQRRKNKIYGSTPEDDEWYQLPNEKALQIAEKLIDEMRYAISFERSQIFRAKRFVNGVFEHEYVLKSKVPGFYQKFLDLYDEISKE